MNLQVALATHLQEATNTSGLIGDRVYPLVIPQKVPGDQSVQFPCVVYETSDVQRSVAYCGTIGTMRTTMRIDCYSPSYDEARALAQAVFEELRDFRGLLGGIVEVKTANLATEFDVQDFEPGVYRVTQSWIFWHLE